MFERKPDALIIGGGLAGLAAALVLKEHGVSNLLLERGDRLGGRVRTENLDGLPAEMGGERIGLDDTRLIAYCHRFNLSLVNRRWTHTMFGANGAREDLPLEYHEKMAALANTAPDLSSDLDNIAWSRFLEQEDFSPSLRKIANIMGRLIYGCDISSFPAGDILSDLEDGVFKTADSLWIQGGNNRLVDSMALDLDPASVRLNSFVTSLQQNQDGVQAICSDGVSFNSRIAILALPPQALLDNIAFSPELPGPLRDALKAVDYAHILKIACRFPIKFCPDDFELIQEDTPNSIYSSAGVLIGYTVYDTVLELASLTEEEGIRQMISALGKCFPDVPPASAYKTVKWEHAFSVYKDASFEQTRVRLSQPWENIFFAGEHMPPDSKNQGYMNGAIASGEFAAFEAIQRLK